MQGNGKADQKYVLTLQRIYVNIVKLLVDTRKILLALIRSNGDVALINTINQEIESLEDKADKLESEFSFMGVSISPDDSIQTGEGNKCSKRNRNFFKSNNIKDNRKLDLTKIYEPNVCKAEPLSKETSRSLNDKLARISDIIIKLKYDLEYDKIRASLDDLFQEGTGLEKDGTVFDYEIHNFMKKFKDKGYKGVIPNDGIFSLYIKPNEKKVSFIINTQNNIQKVEHWQAVYIDADDDMIIEFFDSFGKEPSYQIMKDLKMLVRRMNPDIYLKFKWNKFQKQCNSCKSCAFHCMNFLINRYNGLPFESSVGSNRIMENEKNLEKKFKKFIENEEVSNIQKKKSIIGSGLNNDDYNDDYNDILTLGTLGLFSYISNNFF